ncbi:MAG: DMT family transporter [Candidatus Kapabacteria bacterium]|nr:DMT family transporter [Candidatus Kapabacteria bacterium]
MINFIGELAALGAAFLWSFSPFVFTLAARRIGTIQLNVTRLFVAGIFLFLTIIIAGIEISMTLSQFYLLALSGFIGLVLGDTFLFKSFKEIGPRVTMLIMSLNPALAAIISYFWLKENLSIFGIIGIAVTISGIMLVILEKEANGSHKNKIVVTSLIYAVLATLGQGIGLVFAKLAFMEGYVDSVLATFVRISSSAVIFLILTILTGRFKNPLRLFSEDKKSFGLVILGSILGPFLGVTLSLVSINHTQVGIAATLMATPPIIMLPVSAIFFKEKLSWKSVIGAIIAVGGVAILFLR